MAGLRRRAANIDAALERVTTRGSDRYRRVFIQLRRIAEAIHFYDNAAEERRRWMETMTPELREVYVALDQLRADLAQLKRYPSPHLFVRILGIRYGLACTMINTWW